jgi:flavodoxin
MKAVVLYESVYGNTATVARAIADGLAPVGEVKLAPSGSFPRGSRRRRTCWFWADRPTAGA